jgi:hypothetical protein
MILQNAYKRTYHKGQKGIGINLHHPPLLSSARSLNYSPASVIYESFPLPKYCFL